MPLTAPRAQRVHRRASSGVRVASVDQFIARENLTRQMHGLSTFGGRRNVSTALGYEPTLRARDYRERYERGDIAAAIVEFFPFASWLAGTMMVEVDDPDTVTPFEEGAAKLSDRLGVLDILRQAAILADLGRYSIIIIGAPGDFAQELPRLSSPDSIAYLSAYGEDRATIGRLVTDPYSARFGLPDHYSVNFGSSSIDSSVSLGAARQVHWSRVIHVAKGTLEDRLYGQSILRRIWNRLNDLDKLVGGGAESAWRRMGPKLHLSLDPEMQLTPTQEDELKEALEELQHGFKDTLSTRGAEVKPLSVDLAMFSPQAATVTSLICGSIGISQRILLGTERGELASDQDRNNTADSVTRYKDHFAEPLTIALFRRFVDYGALPEPVEMKVGWPEEDKLTEPEKADVTLKLAQANRTSGTLIMTTAEIRDRIYSLDALDPIDERPPVTTQPTVSVPTETQPAMPTTEILAATAHLASDRVVIIGGPRCGKSTLARHLRETRSIPTFCGDPESLVKDHETSVTYLDDGLAWSDASQYVTDVWLAQLGPWCVEGVSVVRALRKLVAAGNADLLKGVDIVHLQSPQVDQSSGQQSMAKGVETVWNEIAAYFPQAVTVIATETPAVSSVSVASSRTVRGASRKSRRSSIESRKAALFGFRVT
jgi:hypothetical protein